MMRFRLTDPKQAHVTFDYLRGLNLEGWGTHFWMWTLLWSRTCYSLMVTEQEHLSPSHVNCSEMLSFDSFSIAEKISWCSQKMEMTSIYWLFLLSPLESQWVSQTHLQRAPKSPLCFLAFVENSENLAIQPEVLATTGQTGSAVLSGSPLSPLSLLTSS